VFIRSALPVIQLLHATPGSHKSFQSLANPVLFSAINVFLVMLCFQINKLNDDEDAKMTFESSRSQTYSCISACIFLEAMTASLSRDGGVLGILLPAVELYCNPPITVRSITQNRETQNARPQPHEARIADVR